MKAVFLSCLDNKVAFKGTDSLMTNYLKTTII